MRSTLSSQKKKYKRKYWEQRVIKQRYNSFRAQQNFPVLYPFLYSSWEHSVCIRQTNSKNIYLQTKSKTNHKNINNVSIQNCLSFVYMYIHNIYLCTFLFPIRSEITTSLKDLYNNHCISQMNSPGRSLIVAISPISHTKNHRILENILVFEAITTKQPSFL